MDFELIFRIVQFAILSCLFIYFGDRLLKVFETNQDNRRMDLENKKIELFMTIDVDFANEEIDKYVSLHLDDYITNEILGKNIEYIKKDDVADIIKKVTRTVFINMSELYLFYIKLIAHIEDEEQLTKFLYKRVRQQVIEFAANFNRPKEDL